eukprot:gene1069-1354_t
MSNTDSSQQQNSIAIIGIGLRFPGESNDIDKLWENLITKRDCIKTKDPRRWNPKYYMNGEYDTNHLGSVDYQEWAYFDSLFFASSSKETSSIDPQQRLVLKVAWETIEDAQIDPFKMKGSNTSVFMGAHRDNLNVHNPVILIFSTVTTELFNEYDFTSEYIYENIHQPVKFHQTIENIIEYITKTTNQKSVSFIEISPHPTLSYYIRKSGTGSNVTVYNPLNRKSSDSESKQVNHMFSNMYCNSSSPIDFTSQLSTQERQDTTFKSRTLSIPKYQWDEQEFWSEHIKIHQDRIQGPTTDLGGRKVES